MKTNPLALPPSAPVPRRVKRNCPSQKFRSNGGRSTDAGFVSIMVRSAKLHQTSAHRRLYEVGRELNPAALVTGLGHAANGDSIRRIPHVEFLAAGQFRHGDISCSHLDVELAENLVALPEIVHVALYLLEVAAGDSAGIGEEIRNQQNPAFANASIGFWGC